jgi:hypothetical protein
VSAVRQSAGNCHLEVYTGGSPLWPDLRVMQPNGQKVEVRMTEPDLHDLRYCIDRVLTMLGEGKR